MKKKILIIIFLVWIVLWVVFLARELFHKGEFNNYKALIFKSLDGKKSFVTGDRLYEFIVFCKKNIPAGATYKISSKEVKVNSNIMSLSGRRFIYELYPSLINNNPDYIFVFDSPEGKVSGYKLFAKLDDNRYILGRA